MINFQYFTEMTAALNRFTSATVHATEQMRILRGWVRRVDWYRMAGYPYGKTQRGRKKWTKKILNSPR